ncbi:MAG TPA: glycosyltransferase [Actinomycetota bacterium]|jgi:cellulose synthase/poly-beta-1,6-N-acetylglucosamine synthase-like glycosyltransferase|nr:glycosyltransferase [Actinomycetota bacterium]
MFLGLFITFFVAMGAATLLLVTLGHRIRFASRILGLLLGTGLALGSGEVVARYWALDPDSILTSQVILVAAIGFVALTRPKWNPLGQAFFGTFLAAAGSYVFFALAITFAGSLSVVPFIVSFLLLVLELFALALAAYFVFEGVDILCRTKPLRPEPAFDPAYLPKVSLQIPAYNEPPDMLIETIQSIEGIDYPNLEIIVIDNNTTDPDLWRPVEEFCRGRPRVRFVHEENLPGFKAGALNLLIARHMDPDSEIIGVIDADYRVDPAFLKSLVGYFVDPKVAFVQTPQNYRDYEGNTYLTACYDSLNYFFEASMPFRHERNSIIFAGTMGLMRRSALEEVGGWPQWCITEDAETSLRLLRNGYSGVYVKERYGIGILPLTFSAFKGQRFRWAFGGIQILRKHFFHMLPFPRSRSNRLTLAQRVDYLLSCFMWFNDLLYLGFTTILFGTAMIVLGGGSIELRPLRGAIILLPAALIASGLVRAMWSLRVKSRISFKRSAFAFLSWLSLSWTVALACIQHLFRSETSFLRTPKEGTERSFLNALRAARAETAIAVALWGAAIAVAVSGRGTAFLFGLFAWQGLVYASAPLMSWLNVRGELSPELERRRRTEHRRDRMKAFAPVYVGAASLLVVLAALFAIGGTQGSGGPDQLFRLPERVPNASPPPQQQQAGATPAPSPTPTPTPTVAPTITPTPEPVTAPPAANAPTASPAPSPVAPAPEQQAGGGPPSPAPG